jgi:pimeloyl-ACP methyl ester carboxylesterase
MKPDRHLMTPPLQARVFGDSGKTAVLLHGFPDDPGTFEPLLQPLVDDGWRLVVPWMRGYGLSGPAPDGRYDLTTLGGDVLRLLDAVEAAEGVVIGHDWGAVTAYIAAIQHPTRVRAIAALAVPPPRTLFTQTLRHPSLLSRVRYMAQLQNPLFVKRMLAAPNAPLIEKLWREWSPGWRFPEERLAAARAALLAPGCAEAAASYYHQLLPRGPQGLAGWRNTLRDAMRPIPCPGLLLTGATDGCMDPDFFEDAPRAFAGDCAAHVVGNAGHFLHQEAPEAVLQILRPWLAEQAKMLG